MIKTPLLSTPSPPLIPPRGDDAIRTEKAPPLGGNCGIGAIGERSDGGSGGVVTIRTEKAPPLGGNCGIGAIGERSDRGSRGEGPSLFTPEGYYILSIIYYILNSLRKAIIYYRLFIIY